MRRPCKVAKGSSSIRTWLKTRNGIRKGAGEHATKHEQGDVIATPMYCTTPQTKLLYGALAVQSSISILSASPQSIPPRSTQTA